MVTAAEIHRDGTDLVVRWSGTREVTVAVGPALDELTEAELVREGPTVARLHGLGAHAGRHFVRVQSADGTAVVAAERRLPLEGPVNFRDLGGYVGAGGRRVAWGRVYRSDSLESLTAADIELLEHMNVRLICDLRHDDERLGAPNRMDGHASVRIEHLPIGGLAAETKGMSVRMMRGEIPEVDVEMMADIYMSILRLHPESFGTVVAHAADPAKVPMIVHCTAGKDRTGVACALLLSALGVADSAVLEDYELTGRFHSRLKIAEVRPQLEAAGVEFAKVEAYFGAPKAVMATTLATLRAEFGSVDRYLAQAAGVSPDTINALRENLLEPRRVLKPHRDADTNSVMANGTKEQADATAGRNASAFHAAEERRYRERTPRSLELLRKTSQLIPTGHAGGMWYQMPYPVLLERGKGSRVWDVDGNEYLDLRIGDWVLIHGHCNDKIREAVYAQMDQAVQLGSPEWDLAYRMASLVIERMPAVDRVRFLVSGTETNLLALRLARAHTGRTMLAKASGSYHGIADVLVVGQSTISFVTKTIPPGVTPGVAQDVIEFPYNDPDGAEEVIEREAANLAAVIIEPIMGAAGMVPATKEFLQRLREVTARHGIVLIFDEVVTFPIAYGGAQAHFDVMPDLTTMSKAIGGGLPQAILGGRAEIMDLLDPERHDGMAPVTAASTFGGNVTALAAGIACLEQLTPELHAHVQALGKRGRDGIDALGEKYGIPLHATGFGHIFAMHWAPERVVDYRTRMQDDSEKIVNLGIALMNRGCYHFSFGSFLLSTTHTEEDIDYLISAIDDSLHALDYV